MIQIQLINIVIACERKVTLEQDRRNNHRYEPYVNYLATPCAKRKGRLIERVKIIEIEEEGRRDLYTWAYNLGEP